MASDTVFFWQLPESTQVRKDATMALTNCTAVFINYLGTCRPQISFFFSSFFFSLRFDCGWVSAYLHPNVFAGQAAQESASDRNRKTVSADDVLSVIGQMGLPPESQQIMQQHLAGTSSYLYHFIPFPSPLGEALVCD